MVGSIPERGQYRHGGRGRFEMQVSAPKPLPVERAGHD